MTKYPDYLSVIPKDDNGIPLPWSSVGYSGSFQTHDDSTPPVLSPLTLTAGTIVTLTCPRNAVTFHIEVNSGKARVSEMADMSSYFVMGAGTLCSFDIAVLSNIYVAADSGSATISFRMELI